MKQTADNLLSESVFLLAYVRHRFYYKASVQILNVGRLLQICDLGCDINFYLIIKVFLCKIIEDTNILENSWYWMARILKNMAVMNHFPTINLLISSYSEQLVKSEQFCIDHRVYYHQVWLSFGTLNPWLDDLSNKFDKPQWNLGMFR